MTPESSRLVNIARTVTRYTNPSILSVLLVLLIAFTKSDRFSNSLVFIGVISVFYILIPVLYVYLRTKSTGKHLKSVYALTVFLKKRPADILILAFLLGLPCLIILCYLNAPIILIQTVVALLAGSITAAVFNLFYRVSYHLTGITILAIMVAQAWGAIYLIFVVVIPLTCWAKYHIREHTILQLVMGMGVALIVSMAALKLIC
jgi:hypothetical protein